MRTPLPRRPASLVLVASLAVLAGVGAGAARGDGSTAPDRRATQTAAALREAPEPPATPGTPAVSSSAASASTLPRLLEIPRLGIRARIGDVGVDDRTGLMSLPEARKVGWYRYGAAPGSLEGSAVLAGHVDSRTLGLGALYPLREARQGDRIQVTLANGRTLAFRVVSTASYLKTRLPAEELFARDGEPRLRVVTCGGRYVREAGGYEENLVVTAAPDRSRR